MEKKRYSLCLEVLQRMRQEGVLSNVMIVGSWCIPIYKQYFKAENILPPIRTRDLDFLFPTPFRYKGHIDLFELLKDLGFIVVHKGREGYITLQHPDLILEFLAPDRGKGADTPVKIKQLGINAQSLRYLDILLMNPIRIMFEDISVTVPHPANFAFHKLLVAKRRRDQEKGQKDRSQAYAVLGALIDADKIDETSRIYFTLHASWRRSIMLELGDQPEILRMMPFIGKH